MSKSDNSLDIVILVPEIHFYAPLAINRLLSAHPHHHWTIVRTPKLSGTDSSRKQLYQIARKRGLGYLTGQVALRLMYNVLGWWERLVGTRPSERAYIEVDELDDLHSCRTKQVGQISSNEFIDWFQSRSPDVLLSVFFNQIIPPEVYKTTSRGSFNLHPGKLPSYRGYSPVFWQLYEDDPEAGCALHQITGEVDAGPVVEQRTCPIEDQDTFYSLYRRLARIGGQILTDLITTLSASNQPDMTDQFGGSTTYPSFEENHLQEFYDRGNRFWSVTDF